MRFNKSNSKTPRLLSFYGKKVFQSAPLIMKRNEWIQLKPTNHNGSFEVDISLMPFKKMNNPIGCLVTEESQYTFSLKVYRFDENDTQHINVDNYQLYEQISNHPDFLHNVKRASTDYDLNMEESLNENVIIEELMPSSDHHSEIHDIPEQFRERAEKYEREYRVKVLASGSGNKNTTRR